MNNEKEFKPYIPADKVLPELTPVSIILGILLAVVFGGAKHALTAASLGIHTGSGNFHGNYPCNFKKGLHSGE